MAQIGVFVTSTEVPPASSNAFDVANAFVVGFSDWGPVGTAIPISSLANMASALGSPAGTGNPYSSRTAGCATAFDALETFFAEGGYRAYFSRVTHGSPNSAALTLQDNVAATALTVTAQYVGAGGNAIYVAVANAGATYVVTLQDVNGNVLAVSPSLSTNAAGVTWFATTGLATAVAGAGTIPKTISATQMTGGADNHASAVLADWTSALNVFYKTLGPGQVFAPGQTNTNLPGIWSALGTHAQTYNRVALCDMDDNTAASTLISAMPSFNSSATASYMGFWAGNLQIPGSTPGTTRSVSPSAGVAGLCARVDPNGQGNVNTAAAGILWPLNFATQNVATVSGSGGAIYSSTDLYSLNDAGINTFAVTQGQFLNYGFASAVLPAVDAVYWQFDHGRTRMSLVADAQSVGEPFVFSQIDGQGGDQLAFQTALQAMLTGYYDRGALFGATANEAFSVVADSSVNTPTSLQAGQLNAVANVKISPFAQRVSIALNAVPIATTL